MFRRESGGVGEGWAAAGRPNSATHDRRSWKGGLGALHVLLLLFLCQDGCDGGSNSNGVDVCEAPLISTDTHHPPAFSLNPSPLAPSTPPTPPHPSTGLASPSAWPPRWAWPRCRSTCRYLPQRWPTAWCRPRWPTTSTARAASRSSSSWSSWPSPAAAAPSC